MAVTLDAATKVFTVPQADLTFVSGTFYRMDTETYFRAEVNALMDDAAYIWMDTPIRHNTEVVVAGTTYARTIEMINGYSVTFSPDSQWSVELTGSNNNIWDIENGILNQNQVQVIPTNSGGLIGAKQINDQSFSDARVWIDTVNGTTGVAYPNGTPGLPVNNLADAQAIIVARGLPKRLHLRGTLTMTGADNIDDYDIVGPAPLLASIAFGGASTANTHIQGCTLSGAASGDMAVGFCDLGTISGLSGIVHDCGLSGTVTLAAGDTANNYDFVNCHSVIAGTATPTVDANSIAAVNLSIRDYAGGMEIENFDDAGGNASIDLVSGHAILAATCTAGTIVVRGSGHLTDNSAGSTIVKSGLVEGFQLADIHKNEGLETGNPMTVTPTSRSTADSEVDLVLTGDGISTTTVTRQ